MNAYDFEDFRRSSWKFGEERAILSLKGKALDLKGCALHMSRAFGETDASYRARLSTRAREVALAQIGIAAVTVAPAEIERHWWADAWLFLASRGPGIVNLDGEK